MPDEFYIPAAEAVRTQVGKPGAYTFEPIGRDDRRGTCDGHRVELRRVVRPLPGAARAGVAKEVARSVLPVGLYTEFYWSVNARSLMNFLSLRNAAAAQHEIRVYAEAAEIYFASDAGDARLIRGSGTDGALAHARGASSVRSSAVASTASRSRCRGRSTTCTATRSTTPTAGR